MAPTEILAEQHYYNFLQWFEPLGIHVTWLSGRHKQRYKRSVGEDIALGNAQVIIGTHALFQEGMRFRGLGLIVVDEQHRFGVHQRLALREKGIAAQQVPHQLIMTATPIPRTLAMTAYADLDVSTIDELPPGRKPVKTVALPQDKRGQVIQRIEEVCAQGRQVYWVCPIIEESEVLQCQAAEKTYELLQQQLPAQVIALIHGRMLPQEKETIMQRFKNAEINILVATTVIEVGVDVPNASLMILENAERLGLSQLHQLRGRVGRGDVESFCVLLYQPPLSKTAKQRLAVTRDSQDGFVIAQKDLEIRGPGEVLGTKQTGSVQFRIADLKRDQHLLPEVQEAAQWLSEQYQDSINPLINRWLGEGKKYGRV
jgi:ATP-dependent DNA helicase RecG